MPNKSRLLIQILFLLLAAAVWLSAAFPVNTKAALEDELRLEIEKRSQALNELNEQIKSTQENLNRAEAQGRTISSEVKRLSSNINQLDLGIKSAELSLEKLSFEITSLDNEIAAIEQEIKNKGISMSDVLQEVQFRDQESPLVIFLKSRDLSDAVASIQTLLDLNNRLAVESELLKTLHQELRAKREGRAVKKDQVALENKNLRYRREIITDQKEERQKLLSLTKQQETAYSQELAELERQREEIASEIEKIENNLKAALDPNLLPAAGVLGLPIANPPGFSVLTQSYGINSFSARAYKSGFHNGIDFGLPIGSPLFAAEAGEVVAVGNQDNYCYRGAYGKFIVIRHQNNLTTLYAHLSRYLVSPGQTVSRGELIGYSGHTGYSTGPHLHFTVYASPTFYMGPSRYCGQMPFGAHLNPVEYLAQN